MRTPIIAPLALAGLAACASAPNAAISSSAAASSSSLEARARDVQSRVISIDTHVDIEASMGTPANNPCMPTQHKVDLPKMRAGGLDVAFFAVYVGQTARTDANYAKAKQDALAKFAAIHRLAEQACPDQIEIAYHPEDVERIIRAGKLVAAIGIENGYVIGKDLSLIDKYHELGARYMTLAHQGNNDIAGSADLRPQLGDPDTTSGLTAFGEQVVAEMNRVGMMVDASHISKKSALDAIRLSRAPVIASHSSVTAFANVSRNFDDETLDALKRNNGVIQIVAFPGYVKVVPPEKNAAITALNTEFGIPQGRGRAGGGGRGAAQAALDSMPAARRAEFDRRRAAIETKYPAANVQDFVNHIDYAVKRIGIDHVGISSDFDGGGGLTGWNDASETVNVTMELLRRGYTEEQIGKLWGGNLLRVWRDVERVAKELQSRSAS
jgi:membrane dipeptidase